MLVNPGTCGVVELVVRESDTASALGTGDVPVLATPRLISLCEVAAVRALADELDDAHTSVGSRVELAHVAPVAVGALVKATATLERSEGRRLVFSVTVTDERGLVAAGRLTRVVVDKAHFLEKVR